MHRVKSPPVERRFIRHPSRMPIRFDLQGDLTGRDERLRNVSEGGLCFVTRMTLDTGLTIRLTIPVLGEQFAVDGIVAWCRPAGEGYEVGVRFLAAGSLQCPYGRATLLHRRLPSAGGARGRAPV